MNIINQTNQTNQPTNNESIKIDFDNGTLDEVLDLNNKELSQLMHKNIVKNHNERRCHIQMKVNREINHEGFIKTTILITVKNNMKSTLRYFLKFSKKIKFIIAEKKYSKDKLFKTVISDSMLLEYQDPRPFNVCDLMDYIYFKEGYTMRSTKPSNYNHVIELLPKSGENIILNEDYFDLIFNKVRYGFKK